MLTQKQNGAEQPLKIKVILEADNRGEKSPAVKKIMSQIETMAHALAICSLSYGGFTKVHVTLPILSAVTIPRKTKEKN